jgi:hypothetical protein
MDIDDILEMECPNCGERVYYEVLVCPKCGTHLYPQAEENAPEALESSRTTWLKDLSATGIVGGALLAGGAAFLLNQAAAGLWPGQVGAAYQIFVWASGPIAALLGGYLAGVLARRRVLLNGLGVGLLSLAPAYLFEAYRHDLAHEPVGIAALSSWAVMIACGALGGWIYARLSLRAAEQALFAPRPRAKENQLYQELLSLVRHDSATAERLIDLERRRSPKLARDALIQNAVERLRRDRR